MRENLFLGCVKNKGTGQPAHLPSLISAFVIRLLKSMISKHDTSEFFLFWLVSVAEQDLVVNRGDRFSCIMANIT